MSYIHRNALVSENAHALGNAKLYNQSSIKDEAIVSGDVKMYDSAIVRDKAHVSGNLKLAHAAIVGGNLLLVGNGHIQGQAYIEAPEDVLMITYKGKHITAYKTRKENKDFEVNIDGVDSNLVEIACTLDQRLADFINTYFAKQHKTIIERKHLA